MTRLSPAELRLNAGPASAGLLSSAPFLSDLDSFHLKERLAENEDFMLVPAEAWHKLLLWYGVVDGQPALERKVLVHTNTQTLCVCAFDPVFWFRWWTCPAL